MPRRLLPAVLLTLAAVLAPVLAPAAGPVATAAVPAAAVADDPSADGSPYPTTDDIAKAKAEADGKAASAAVIEARLATAQRELDEAGQAAEQAVEAYNGAQVRLTEARAAASAATASAAQAEAARAEAAEDAAWLAAASYRLGGSPELSAIDALLGTRGPRALNEQAAVVSAAGATTRQILDAATSTATAATEADRTARAAGDQAQRAADTVTRAKAQAQARLTAQQVLVAGLGRRREELFGELAAARHTTVDLERRRQSALEAIAARKAEEAAKAQALAQAQAEAQAAAQAEADARARADADAAAQAAPAKQHPAPLTAREADWSEQGAQAALAFARTKLGLPYIWGGEGPDGYDCSGLTMLAWRQAGKRLTHFAADQYAESTPISYRQLAPGDLIFWSHTGHAADIYHVAIYLGDDQMIEAPRPGAAIKQASLWIMGRPDFYARP